MYSFRGPCERRAGGGRGHGPDAASGTHISTARQRLSAQGPQAYLHPDTHSSAIPRASRGAGRTRQTLAALARVRTREVRLNTKVAGTEGLVEILYRRGVPRNPGPGGWAAWLSSGDREKELAGAEALTTNNRMELTAVIRALEALKRSGARARCTRTPSTFGAASRSGCAHGRVVGGSPRTASR